MIAVVGALLTCVRETIAHLLAALEMEKHQQLQPPVLKL